MDPGSPSGTADPGSLVDLQDGREATSSVTHSENWRGHRQPPPTCIPGRSSLHPTSGRVKSTMLGARDAQELNSVNKWNTRKHAGINDVICILSALGKLCGYHAIIKTTSSEGSVPASVAPGRLQGSGQEGSSARGVLPSPRATTWPCKSVPGPPAGLGPLRTQRTFGLWLLSCDGTSEFLPLGEAAQLEPGAASGLLANTASSAPPCRCCDGEFEPQTLRKPRRAVYRPSLSHVHVGKTPGSDQ